MPFIDTAASPNSFLDPLRITIIDWNRLIASSLSHALLCRTLIRLEFYIGVEVDHLTHHTELSLVGTAFNLYGIFIPRVTVICVSNSLNMDCGKFPKNEELGLIRGTLRMPEVEDVKFVKAQTMENLQRASKRRNGASDS